DVLEALVPVIARWRKKRFALPLVADREYLESARDAFPMELDDIRRQHRVLAGADPFAAVVVERAALRRQCEHEARGKLLRLRALFLDAAGRPAALEQLMVESLKSFLVVLRHLIKLRGAEEANGYGEVLAAGARLLGPLPVMQRLLDHRAVDTTAPLDDFTYAMRIADAWKPGRKREDTGVVFLVATRDRKLRILVGYGLEGILPDGLVGEIEDREVVPAFRAGRIDEGVWR